MDRYSFEARSKVIGSSDAVKLMGDGDAWCELFRLKTDRAYYEANQKRAAAAVIVRAGRALEPVNLQLVAEKIGRPIQTDLPGFVAADMPYLVAMPDGVVHDLDYEGVKYHGPSAVEVKACGGWQDAEERFRQYYPQVQHEIYCMDAPGCLFGLMIGTTSHYTAYAGIDLDFLSEYRERAKRFLVDHLLPGVLPAPSTLPAFKYVIPEGMVPQVRDLSEDPGWKALARAFAEEKAFKEEQAQAAKGLREKVMQRFAALKTVKMVKVGQCRFSLTKAGVVQFRDLGAGDDE